MFKRRKPDELPADAMDEGGHLDEAPAPGGQGPGSRPADTGLGVPPFRPAPPKEVPAMGRSPFAAAPGGSPTPMPAPTPAPGAPAGLRPQPARPSGRDPAERRTLVVGRGISLQGTVQDAERLVVEGTVEASMIHATELAVSPGGVFKGEIEVEDAEIAGTVDGTVTARGSLSVRATGKVLGTARCRRLQVEDGGQITGRMEMITEPARAEPARTVSSDSTAA